MAILHPYGDWQSHRQLPQAAVVYTHDRTKLGLGLSYQHACQPIKDQPNKRPALVTLPGKAGQMHQ